MTQEGATTEIVSLSDGEFQAMNSDIEPADTFTADKAAKDADPGDYDALLLPGGTVNADRLRMDPDVRSFVQAVVRAGKPVGVICHGPWTLVSADLVQGRTLTSFPSLEVDIRNAGGKWVDRRGGRHRQRAGLQPQPGRPGRVLRQGGGGVRRGRSPGARRGPPRGDARRVTGMNVG